MAGHWALYSKSPSANGNGTVQSEAYYLSESSVIHYLGCTTALFRFDWKGTKHSKQEKWEHAPAKCMEWQKIQCSSCSAHLFYAQADSHAAHMFIKDHYMHRVGQSGQVVGVLHTPVTSSLLKCMKAFWSGGDASRRVEIRNDQKGRAALECHWLNCPSATKEQYGQEDLGKKIWDLEKQQQTKKGSNGIPISCSPRETQVRRECEANGWGEKKAKDWEASERENHLRINLAESTDWFELPNQMRILDCVYCFLLPLSMDLTMSVFAFHWFCVVRWCQYSSTALCLKTCK